MKKLSIVILSSVMLASAAAAGAAVPVKLLGDPATSAQAQRTIVITPETRYVNVTEGEVVTFVENGQAFTWDFDSGAISSFALNRVAPDGVLDHPVTAYVARNLQMWD
ncbi:MAG TPA: CzcE family metal-binding protein [Albitalea sp.]|nr:CzcE family metal-binding protein [Albitalea sp.]